MDVNGDLVKKNGLNPLGPADIDGEHADAKVIKRYLYKCERSKNMCLFLSDFFSPLHVEYYETIQFPSQESFEKFTEQWASQEPQGFLNGCLSCFFFVVFFLSCSVP